MSLFKWSKTAATNATADGTINWAEGQSPGSVNDSARAMMAAVAKYRDDLAGTITTGGSSTAYTVTSNQVFNSLANMSGKTIAFIPHATNDATVTLNVDGLGAKALRSAPSVELGAGVLVEGTPYTAVYNNSNAEWILHGFYADPFSIPLGAMIDYTAATSPNSNFVLPYGQAISRTVYSAYFDKVGTTYGPGDGTTTFNVVDVRGRVVAGKDDMGGSAASRLTTTYFGTSAAALGAVGGSESHTLVSGEMPSHTHTANVTDPGHGHPGSTANLQINAGGGAGASDVRTGGSLALDIATATTGITVSNTNTGGGGAHKNVQPTIVMNKLLRIF